MPTPPASEPEPVPVLTIEITTSPADLLAGHKLISDSIAQQRATLVRSLLYGQPHLTIPPYILLISFLWSQNSNSIGTALLLISGCTIAVLSAAGRLADDYIAQAEKMGSTGGYAEMMESRREVVVAKWGETREVIGVAVVELVKEGKGKGVVNALAVRLRYRRRGVGKGLLEEVVRVVKARLGNEAVVVFADNHANSFRIASVPKIFNKVFDKEERKIRAMLQDVVKSQAA